MKSPTCQCHGSPHSWPSDAQGVFVGEGAVVTGGGLHYNPKPGGPAPITLPPGSPVQRGRIHCILLLPPKSWTAFLHFGRQTEAWDPSSDTS